jgi:hypothetical protein
MIYVADITTPKNTAKTALKKTTIHVTKGLVYKVEFYFPSGGAGLMGVAVFDGLYQVWPSSVGEFFVSDDETISFDDTYLKESAPFELQAYSYNTDDTYDHVAGVRIGLVSAEVFMARFLPTKGYDYLVELTAKMEAEKAELAAMQKELISETPFEWLARQEVSEQ